MKKSNINNNIQKKKFVTKSQILIKNYIKN